MTDSFDTGGSERQFAALAKSLDRSLFRVHLGCISKRGGFLEGLGEVTEFPLGGNLYALQSLRARARLSRHLRRCRISVAHAFDFYTNLTLIPAARIACVPVLIGSQRQLGDLLSPARSRAQRIVLGWCDSVVCNSRAAADRLISNGISENRVAIIHNGLPASAFARTAPALPRPPNLLRIGMIARMNSRSKNHQLFLRAAARLHIQFPFLEFVLAGDGELRPELEREASDLGIRNQVRFLGDRRDIPGVLASLDVSVLPSASESLSNVIIESMAAGVPVVAARVGGNTELIADDRGILIRPGDETALGVEIERLLRDSSMRSNLGAKAKKFAETHFTIAEMQRRHQDLYAELLDRKIRRNPLGSYHPRRSGRRLRVAIVAPSPRYVGGQSVQAQLLSSRLRDDPAMQAHLLEIDPVFPFGLKWIGRIPFLRTIVRTPLYLCELWRGLKDVDVAHIFSASYWSFLVAPAPAWLIARLRGAKTLIHYHSGEARDHMSRSRTSRLILRHTDRLVVPSRYLAEVFREVGLQAQVVPNIANLAQFSYRVREPVRPHLLCTRAFHPYYGIDIVLRAFAEVQRDYPEARLDLVGGGPLEPQLRRLVDRLQLAGVNFVGIAPHEQIAKFYDRADIFINGSYLDNMPVSILEAFASGTPVVSTAPEGMRYLVEHERTGLLSEPGDAVALGQNVVRLLHGSTVSSELARNAYMECYRYSWATVRGHWLEIYESLARSDCEAPKTHCATGDFSCG